MELLNNLTVNISFGNIHEFINNFKEKQNYVYKLLTESSDKNDEQTNRIITLSTAIIMINAFNGYVNEDELEAKRNELNDELETLQEEQAKQTTSLRKGPSNYQHVSDLLKQL